MQRVISSLFLLGLGLAALPAGSEEVALLPGQTRPYSVAANAASSFKSAQLVVLGKFRRVAAQGKAGDLVEVEFEIDKVISGKKPDASVLHLRLPVPVADGKAAPVKPDSKALDAARASQATLETLLEQKKLDDASFQTQVSHNRELLQHSDDYLRKFVLVKVTMGALDAPYRNVDVLLNFDEPVILMLGADYRERKPAQYLFSNQLDIYPASDARVLHAIGLK